MRPTDVTITDVDTHIVANPWKPWVIVRLHTDAGVTGIAEATLHGKPRTVATAVEEMARYYVGASPFDTEELFLEMYRDEAYSDNAVNTTVISAVDVACHDIRGKLLDVPAYELLGGAVNGTSLRAYANGWYTGTDGDPDAFADAAESVVADGYDAMKFDPFGTAWERMTRADRERALDRIRAVREAVGPGIDLLIEGHGRFTPGAAVELARDMEPFDPTFFEEPTHHDSVEGLRRVAAKSSIPIATGERRMSKYPFRDLLVETDVDVLQPDFANCGGITEGKKIAAMAEAEHVSVAPHNPQGPVATAMYAHVCATMPNFTIQETFLDYDADWTAELLSDPVRIEDGDLQVPEGPGLGIELNMDVVEEHVYEGRDAIDHIDLFESGWEDRAKDLR
jgi:galactonate dehydratase